MVALACVSPATTPPATLAVLIVAQRRPIGDALGVAVLGVIAHAVQGLLRPAGGLSYGLWLLLDVVTHAALVALGAWMQARARLIGSLVHRAQRAEEEQGRRIAEARAAERARIAREMHDVLAPGFPWCPHTPARSSIARMPHPRNAPRPLVSSDPVSKKPWTSSERSSQRSAKTPMSMATDCPQPTAADLPRLIEESRSAGTAVAVRGSLEELSGLPPMSGRTAYRLIQDGLTNARRHAPGQPVTLMVSTAGLA
jgi:signal transduction histidine kinase